MADQSRFGSLAAFLRRYAKSWVHGVATAAMTAFGTLTFVDRRFAALALAAYLVPPLAMYVSRATNAGRGGGDSDGRSEAPDDNADFDADATADVDAPGDADVPGDTDGLERSWSVASARTDVDLRDVAAAGGTRYAVGGDGVVLAADGDGWRTSLANGPRAAGRDLAGVAIAGRSGAAWTVGASGTVARLDPEAGRHVDHSEPGGDTNDLVAVAAAGGSEGVDREVVLVADGSGRVRRGAYRDGDLTWRDPVTPGSGSSVAGLALVDDGRGVVCDTNQCVFETADGGRSFRQVGVDDVDGTLTDVAATPNATAVTVADGTVHDYRDGEWTPTRAADVALRALDGREDRLVAVGDDGVVVDRRAERAWDRATTPTHARLDAVAVDESGVVVVGEAGTVLERSAE